MSPGHSQERVSEAGRPQSGWSFPLWGRQDLVNGVAKQKAVEAEVIDVVLLVGKRGMLVIKLLLCVQLRVKKQS